MSSSSKVQKLPPTEDVLKYVLELCNELYHGYHARPSDTDSALFTHWHTQYTIKAVVFAKLLAKYAVKELPAVGIACAYQSNAMVM